MNPNAPQNAGRPLPPRPGQRPVFDVMRPGRAPASSTSKPVITGHKPMVRDASITGLRPAPVRRPLMNATQKVTLQPGSIASMPVPSSAPQPARPAPAATLAAPPQNPTAPPSAMPAASVPLASRVPAQPVPASPTPRPTPVVSDDTGPLTVPTPPSTPVPQETASEDALFNGLTSSEENPKTFEPVAVSRRIGPAEFPVKNTILSVIVLLLIAMLINILLDADFLSWGVPHTDFL